MQPISNTIASSLTNQNELKKQVPVKKVDTHTNHADMSPGTETKAQNSKDHQPITPAAVLSISATNIVVSSEGNLYRSNVSWSKTI